MIWAHSKVETTHKVTLNQVNSTFRPKIEKVLFGFQEKDGGNEIWLLVLCLDLGNVIRGRFANGI